jgi:hypothetical protein
MDRKGPIESNLIGIYAQKASADRVECARPSQAIRERAGMCPGGDPFDPARHFGGGAAREGKQQDSARIGSAHNNMCNSMRQCVGLARSRAGNNQ